MHGWHARGKCGSCGFSPASASRSRDLVRRERRRAGPCLWPPRWAANTRQPASEARPGRASVPTAMNGGGSPCRSTALLGFMPFAVLILPASQVRCFHPPAPTCRSSERPSRSLRFSNSGRSAAYLSHASGRSMAQPPARRICGTADHGRSDSAPGFAPAAKPCRAGLCTHRGRYCPGLCLLQVCGHQPVCVLRLDAKHAVSPGTRLQTPSRLQASFPLPGPYAPELRQPFGF